MADDRGSIDGDETDCKIAALFKPIDQLGFVGSTERGLDDGVNRRTIDNPLSTDGDGHECGSRPLELREDSFAFSSESASTGSVPPS